MGIATILVVVLLVVVIAVAGIAVYYYSVSSGSSSSSTTSTASSSSSTTHSSVSSTSSSSTPVSTTSSQTSSTGSSTANTYGGTFNYSVPLGPSGERILPNNTVQTYGSVQVTSGFFAFSINPANYSGTGNGHGTITVTTTGFCSGKVTISYAFTIQAVWVPTENLTIGFHTPNPANVTVPLSCTGPMNGVDTSTNNPITFLSEYPGLISTSSVPYTVDQHLSGNITYYCNFVQMS